MNNDNSKRYSVHYTHKIRPQATDVGPDVMLSSAALTDCKTLGAALREAGALISGGRVRAFRIEADKIVIFPVCPRLTTYWRAITLTAI